MDFDKMTAREFARELVMLPWDVALRIIIKVAKEPKRNNHGKIQ